MYSGQPPPTASTIAVLQKIFQMFYFAEVLKIIFRQEELPAPWRPAGRHWRFLESEACP